VAGFRGRGRSPMRISFTLSRYIFADLLRIFLMASGALAGIMSFGGLLRPLTQQGLDATQVGQLLTYFTPAMTAYSFPIAVEMMTPASISSAKAVASVFEWSSPPMLRLMTLMLESSAAASALL